jgi:hypothetical protein
VNTIYARVLKTVRARNLFFYAYLNFKLRLSDFGIVVPEGWSDEITIQIYQALLKNEIKKVSSESVKMIKKDGFFIANIFFYDFKLVYN